MPAAAPATQDDPRIPMDMAALAYGGGSLSPNSGAEGFDPDGEHICPHYPCTFRVNR